MPEPDQHTDAAMSRPPHGGENDTSSDQRPSWPELVARARDQEDPGAFASILHRYGPHVAAVLEETDGSGRRSTPAAARDPRDGLVQTFLIAMRRLDRAPDQDPDPRPAGGTVQAADPHPEQAPDPDAEPTPDGTSDETPAPGGRMIGDDPLAAWLAGLAVHGRRASRTTRDTTAGRRRARASAADHPTATMGHPADAPAPPLPAGLLDQVWAELAPRWPNGRRRWRAPGWLLPAATILTLVVLAAVIPYALLVTAGERERIAPPIEEVVATPIEDAGLEPEDLRTRWEPTPLESWLEEHDDPEPSAPSSGDDADDGAGQAGSSNQASSGEPAGSAAPHQEPTEGSSR